MSRKAVGISINTETILHNIINGKLEIYSKWLQLTLLLHWKVLEDL
jgi:hypothetical protein